MDRNSVRSEGKERKKEDLHQLKDSEYPKDDIQDLENHKESITINGSLTILEDEFEQKTIWRRKIPTKEHLIYITTRIEK
jgi:hypothetical protein